MMPSAYCHILGAYHYSSYPNDPPENSEIVDNSMEDEIIDVTEVNGDFFTESCSTAKAEELSVVTGVYLQDVLCNHKLTTCMKYH